MKRLIAMFAVVFMADAVVAQPPPPPPLYVTIQVCGVWYTNAEAPVSFSPEGLALTLPQAAQAAQYFEFAGTYGGTKNTPDSAKDALWFWGS